MNADQLSSHASYFIWLLRQSLDFLNIPLFAMPCLLLAAAAGISTILQRPFRQRWKGHYWLVLSQFLFFPAILALGTLFRAGLGVPPVSNNAGSPAETGIEILLFLSFGLGCFWVALMKGVRWFALCLLALLQIFLLSAAFVSGMSTSGDWL